MLWSDFFRVLQVVEAFSRSLGTVARCRPARPARSTERQQDRERGPFADPAPDGYRPLVGQDDVLDDGQSEAGAAQLLGPGLVDDIETLEDVREVIGADAGPGVFDIDRQVGLANGQADLYGALLRVLHG